MRIKICGITRPDQAIEIARLGATALGFILVPSSPRYVTPAAIAAILAKVDRDVQYIGVFAAAEPETIVAAVRESGIDRVQLHGDESPEFCARIRELLPGIEIIKALRVKDAATLEKAASYSDSVDTLLLDAYDPRQLGGTGRALDWEAIAAFRPPLPWFLAGGLTPDNIGDALTRLSPDGIDLSSGVERSPGDKDLAKVASLFDRLRDFRREARDKSKDYIY
jgi:phosphoribosylanthranilate isomerase